MNEKILIVDDEPSIRKILNTLLSQRGYQVLEAENGKERIELCNNQNFDLVITIRNFAKPIDNDILISTIKEVLT